MNFPGEVKQRSTGYEVLSPWAEADPVPLRGISARAADLSGKTVGLFSNRKRAAVLTLTEVEKALQDKFPGLKTEWYESTVVNQPEILTGGKARFETWVEGVDAVVLSVAD